MNVGASQNIHQFLQQFTHSLSHHQDCTLSHPINYSVLKLFTARLEKAAFTDLKQNRYQRYKK